MKLDEIYLTESQTKALIEKTNEYNRLHPNDKITFQEMVERLLDLVLLSSITI